jgi:hypothetical protein
MDIYLFAGLHDYVSLSPVLHAIQSIPGNLHNKGKACKEYFRIIQGRLIGT